MQRIWKNGKRLCLYGPFYGREGSKAGMETTDKGGMQLLGMPYRKKSSLAFINLLLPAFVNCSNAHDILPSFEEL